MGNRKKDEHMIIFSNDHSEDLLKKYFYHDDNDEEREQNILGQLHLSACWIKPIYAMKTSSTIVGGEADGITPNRQNITEKGLNKWKSMMNKMVGKEEHLENDNRDRVVVGSSIRYVFSGDVGGNIPQWAQNKAGPKATYGSLRGLLNYASE